MNTRVRGGIAAGLILAAGAVSAHAQRERHGPADEFRGMWVSRFEWPHRDGARARATIDAIMANLAEHNFNAVLFQVRGQADVFYHSPEEPWSPIISPDGSDPGWDPLAYALNAAREHGLEFHAYINTHVAWQSSTGEPPAAPSHVYHRHCDARSPETSDWLIHDALGEPIAFSSDNYVWLAPGVPACQAYIRRQVMYVVENYDVDGIHFDRIRTPTANVSHDPISTARREPGAEGNPHDLDFADWTRDQFTRFLRDMYAQIMEVKPHIKISSCPLGLYRQERYPNYPAGFHYGWSKTLQDAQAWLAAGAQDFIVPQIYWADDGRPPNFREVLPDWVEHSAGRHIYAGQSVRHDVPELIRQVRFTRQSGAQGNVMFSYGRFNSREYFQHYSARRGIYAAPAATPEFTWKTNPTEGIIIGHVTDVATGEPIVDAQIRHGHADDVALSSGDGLYSFLRVPPGEYALDIRKQGYPAAQIDAVRVEAGQVVRVDVALGEPPAVALAPEQPDVPERLTEPEPPAPEPAVTIPEPEPVEPEVARAEDPEPAAAPPPDAPKYAPPPAPPVPVGTVTERTGSHPAVWIAIVVLMLIGWGAVIVVVLVRGQRGRA